MSSPPSVFRFPPGAEIDGDLDRLRPDAPVGQTPAEQALDRLERFLALGPTYRPDAISLIAATGFHPSRSLPAPSASEAHFASTSRPSFGPDVERPFEEGPPLADEAEAEPRPTVPTRAGALPKVSKGAVLLATAVAVFFALGVVSDPLKWWRTPNPPPGRQTASRPDRDNPDAGAFLLAPQKPSQSSDGAAAGKVSFDPGAPQANLHPAVATPPPAAASIAPPAEPEEKPAEKKPIDETRPSASVPDSEPPAAPTATAPEQAPSGTSDVLSDPPLPPVRPGTNRKHEQHEKLSRTPGVARGAPPGAVPGAASPSLNSSRSLIRGADR
jgi:hypothetical protein